MIKIGLLLLIIPSLYLMGGYMQELSIVNECVASGGAFDYEQLACKESGTYPFIPYQARHPLAVNGGMLVSVLGLFFCIAGLYRRAS